MINVLITGADGQLGTEIQNKVRDSKIKSAIFNLLPTDVSRLDITDSDAVNRFITDNSVDIIINCAAYTAVEKAETDIEMADKINRLGVEVLANIAARKDKTLVQISTDYVFDGMAHVPYCENATTMPMSVYGRTKLAGETAMRHSGCRGVIIRTSWLYSPYGNNFVKTMRRLGSERELLNVVCDQIGTPTYAADLAEAILIIVPLLVKTDKRGEIYHFSDEGVCSWYDFACRIMRLSSLKCKVCPVESKNYPSVVTRPMYSVLNKNKIKRDFGIEIPQWEDSLDACLRRL